MSDFRNLPDEMSGKRQVKKVQPIKDEPVISEAFSNAVLKESSSTLTGNGGLAYDKLSDQFVTDFTQASRYLANLAKVKGDVYAVHTKDGGDWETIHNRMSGLWSENPRLAIANILILRGISRKTALQGESTMHTGTGLKHEPLWRMHWLGTFHPDTFFKILPYYIAVGSWRDVFNLMIVDLMVYANKDWSKRGLKWDKLAEFIKQAAFEDESQKGLVWKYMPVQISSGKNIGDWQKTRNILAKFLAKHFYGFSNEKEKIAAYKQLRKDKVKYGVHVWQKYISRQEYEAINFDSIHGKALTLLQKSDFFSKHGLGEAFSEWLESKSNTEVKVTSFPHELWQMVKENDSAQTARLFNKQFLSLIEKTKQEGVTVGKPLFVLDVSGSMTSKVQNINMSAMEVEMAMATFFILLTGQKLVAMFTDDVKFYKVRQNEPYDIIKDMLGFVKGINFGSTNPVSVAEFIARLYEEGKISVDDIPTLFVMTSDGDFNWYCGTEGKLQSMHKTFLDTLLNAGIPTSKVNQIKIVLWDIPNSWYGNNRNRVYDSYDANGSVMLYIAGYDASLLQNIYKGQIKTTKDIYMSLVEQPIVQAAMEKIEG